MIGRLLRVTGTVLVITVALVIPVLATATATPAAADTVINGCTIVSNPTAANFTNCPGANLQSVLPDDVDLSYANLAGADLAGNVLATCSPTNNFPFSSCSSVNFSNANLSQADLSQSTFVVCIVVNIGPPIACDAANLANSNLTNANLSSSVLTVDTIAGTAAPDLMGATLTGANFTGTELVPSNQSVTATSQAGAVVTWPTPPSLSGAIPGSCTPSEGSTFPIGTTTVTCQVLDSANDVATGTFTVDVTVPPPTTAVGLPANGATITGGTGLDAAASSPVGIASVTFEVSGGSISNQVVSPGFPTLFGWLGGWDSTDVPNGTYTLQSVATDVDGVSSTSAAITVTVNNPPPSTSVLIPSTGATLSGGAALLDASAPGASSVTFELTGGTLSNQVIASGTLALWGWYAQWNSASVQNGSYTLQSVATEPGGSMVTSAPITITVSN